MQDKNELAVISIGDKVEVDYSDSFNLIRYKKFNGHEAVIVKQTPEIKPYQYYLRFINEDVNNEYIEDSGGIEFKREWLKKIEITKEEKQKLIKSYANIDNQKMPECKSDKLEKPKVQKVELLNLSKACKYLEENGMPGIRNRMWIYLKDKINEENIFKIKLEHTENELVNNHELTSDILLDLKLIKEEWEIEGRYVYVAVKEEC